MDGTGAPPLELIKAWRIDWLGGAANLGPYDELDERELTRMQRAKNYYDAYSAWRGGMSGLAERNPQMAQLAWQIEAVKMEQVQAERKRQGKAADNDNDLLAALGLDEHGNLI